MTTVLWKMNLICNKYNLDDRTFNLILDCLIDPKNNEKVALLQKEGIIHLVPNIIKDISDSGIMLKGN
jgi:hypothetical protein